MFGRSMKLFKLLGFEVKIDLSWLVIAVLVTWSLAKGALSRLVSEPHPDDLLDHGGGGGPGALRLHRGP